MIDAYFPVSCLQKLSIRYNIRTLIQSEHSRLRTVHFQCYEYLILKPSDSGTLSPRRQTAYSSLKLQFELASHTAYFVTTTRQFPSKTLAPPVEVSRHVSNTSVAYVTMSATEMRTWESCRSGDDKAIVHGLLPLWNRQPFQYLFCL